MTPLFSALTALRRPDTLMRAARFYTKDYNRAHVLKRLTRKQKVPAPGIALHDLMALESELEETRQAGLAGYSVARHIEVLAAIMGEVALLPEFGEAAQPG